MRLVVVMCLRFFFRRRKWLIVTMCALCCKYLYLFYYARILGGYLYKYRAFITTLGLFIDKTIYKLGLSLSSADIFCCKCKSRYSLKKCKLEANLSGLIFFLFLLERWTWRYLKTTLDCKISGIWHLKAIYAKVSSAERKHFFRKWSFYFILKPLNFWAFRVDFKLYVQKLRIISTVAPPDWNRSWYRYSVVQLHLGPNSGVS